MADVHGAARTGETQGLTRPPLSDADSQQVPPQPLFTRRTGHQNNVILARYDR